MGDYFKHKCVKMYQLFGTIFLYRRQNCYGTIDKVINKNLSSRLMLGIIKSVNCMILACLLITIILLIRCKDKVIYTKNFHGYKKH